MQSAGGAFGPAGRDRRHYDYDSYGNDSYDDDGDYDDDDDDRVRVPDLRCLPDLDLRHLSETTRSEVAENKCAL